MYPNGWSGGAWNVETHNGELVLCADYAEPGNNQERAWHITPPTDPMCVGEPVFALADAVREAAAFIGLLPHDADTK